MTRPQDAGSSSRDSANFAAEPVSAHAKQLLDEALRQMHTVAENSADYVEFVAAARNLGRQAFALSPVVEGLVACSLQLTFPKTNWETPGSRALIQELSATLFADPQCAARLERLWDRLQGDM